MARNRTKQGGAQAPIRGYDNWTIGELRQKLARRSREELERLLGYEKGGRKRKGAIDAIKRVISDMGESMRGGGSSKGGSTKKSGGSAKKNGEKSRPGGSEQSRGARMGAMVERMRSGMESGVKKMRELVGLTPQALGEFSRESFMDSLSEFLEHERNGAKLYELGLEKEGVTEEQRERLQEFYEQTQRHVEILSNIIMALDGDPDELSEMAQLNRQKAAGLMDTDTEGAVGLLNYFQNLMIAEFVDHMNWEFLTKVRGKIDDEEVGQVLDQHIESIEDEEDEHYRWAMKQVENLSMLNVFPAAEVIEAGGEGEEEAEESEAGEEEEEEEGEESEEEEALEETEAKEQQESGDADDDEEAA